MHGLDSRAAHMIVVLNWAGVVVLGWLPLGGACLWEVGSQGGPGGMPQVHCRFSCVIVVEHNK